MRSPASIRAGSTCLVDLPVPSVDPEEVRRITESVLARPEFLEARPSWWRQVLRYITDWIARLLEALGGGDRGSVIGTVVLVVLALVTAIVIWRFTATVRRDPGQDLAVEGGYGRSAADWLADAQQLEAAAQWRDALRCRYRALLAALAAEGLLEEVPGRTTGEYLAVVVEDLPTAQEPFRIVTRAFEAAWYGHMPVDGREVRQFADTSEDVLRSAGVRSRQAVGAP